MASCSLPKTAIALDIEDWQRTLSTVGGVVATRPVTHADGTTRKSTVPAAAVAAGGGHLCPHELYVFIGEEVPYGKAAWQCKSSMTGYPARSAADERPSYRIACARIDSASAQM